MKITDIFGIFLLFFAIFLLIVTHSQSYLIHYEIQMSIHLPDVIENGWKWMARDWYGQFTHIYTTIYKFYKKTHPFVTDDGQVAFEHVMLTLQILQKLAEL